jgi:hypothetical protein
MASSNAEAAVKKLARVPGNTVCANCGTTRKFGFGTVCIKYLTFVCNNCKSSHQAISHRCKSLTMSAWTDGEVLQLKKHGNDHARATWLAHAPPIGSNGRPKEGDHIAVFKGFILDVYERKKYYGEASGVAPPMQASAPPPPPRAAPRSAPVRVSAPVVMPTRRAPAPPPAPSPAPVIDLFAFDGGITAAAPAPSGFANDPFASQPAIAAALAASPPVPMTDPFAPSPAAAAPASYNDPFAAQPVAARVSAPAPSFDAFSTTAMSTAMPTTAHVKKPVMNSSSSSGMSNAISFMAAPAPASGGIPRSAFGSMGIAPAPVSGGLPVSSFGFTNANQGQTHVMQQQQLQMQRMMMMQQQQTAGFGGMGNTGMMANSNQMFNNNTGVNNNNTMMMNQGGGTNFNNMQQQQQPGSSISSSFGAPQQKSNKPDPFADLKF